MKSQNYDSCIDVSNQMLEMTLRIYLCSQKVTIVTYGYHAIKL